MAEAGHDVKCAKCGRRFDYDRIGGVYVKKSRRYICPTCARGGNKSEPGDWKYAYHALLIFGVLALIVGISDIAYLISGLICLSLWTMIFLISRHFSKKKEIHKNPVTETGFKTAPPVQKMGKYPDKMNGQPLKYFYVMDFTPAPGVDVRTEILKDAEKIVDVKANGEKIDLIYENRVFGEILDKKKAEMLSDYEKRGNCANAVLLDAGNQVNLRFYRDFRIGNEYREQSVIKLTGYKGAAKQEIIADLEPGAPVELEEDYDHENAVFALADGEAIGKLPAKTARRVLSESAYGAVIEEIQEEEKDDGDTVYAPTIRIYW